MTNTEKQPLSRWIRRCFVLILGVVTVCCAHGPSARFDEERAIRSWLRQEPVLSDPVFSLFGTPAGHDGARIMEEARAVCDGVRQWLGGGAPQTAIRIRILSPRNPAGEHFLAKIRSRHRATGLFLRRERLVIAVGDADDPRFWIVLRHEVVHAVMDAWLPSGTDLPFWLGEGAAALFEYGMQSGRPVMNRERLAFLRHELERSRRLDPDALIRGAGKESRTGKAYALAWAIAAWIHERNLPADAYLNALLAGASSSESLFREHFLAGDPPMASFLLPWVRKNIGVTH